MTEFSIPEVSQFVVDAICQMLIQDQGMLRPPEKAAHLLGLIVELHKKKEPFPRREDVAEAIGASISTIDAALSTRLDEGYITQAIATRHGGVQRRNSAVRERYYIPSAELIKVVDRAKAAERRARSR